MDLNPKLSLMACAGLSAALPGGRGADHGCHGALAVRGLLPLRLLLARGGPRPLLSQLPAHGRPEGAQQEAAMLTFGLYGRSPSQAPKKQD